MYALPPQVCRFVETVVLGTSRALDLDDDLDDRALGRRPAPWEIQASPLVGSQLAEAQHADRDSRGERAEAGRTRHLEPRGRHPAHLLRENAAVEGGEPQAPGPPACQEDGRRQHDGPALTDSERCRGKRSGKHSGSDSTRLLHEGCGQPRAEGGGEEVWGGEPA